MRYASYFTVRNPEVIPSEYRDRGDRANALRLETVSQAEAEAKATNMYRSEGLIAQIHEVTR